MCEDASMLSLQEQKADGCAVYPYLAKAQKERVGCFVRCQSKLLLHNVEASEHVLSLVRNSLNEERPFHQLLIILFKCLFLLFLVFLLMSSNTFFNVMKIIFGLEKARFYFKQHLFR